MLNKNNVSAYPNKAYASATLGYASMKQKKYAEAEPYLKQAVDWTEIEGAKKSPMPANIAFTFYITFLRESNREKDALALEEKIKKCSRKSFLQNQTEKRRRSNLNDAFCN